MSRAKWEGDADLEAGWGSLWLMADQCAVARVRVHEDGFAWHSWAAADVDTDTLVGEGTAASLDDAKAAAEAAIRSHARRLLELVGEEP